MIVLALLALAFGKIALGPEYDEAVIELGQSDYAYKYKPDGIRCALGTTCNSCINKPHFWFALGCTACGTEVFSEGTRCAPITEDLEQAKAAEEVLLEEAHVAVRRRSSCKHCTEKAHWWWRYGAWACGVEPKWADGIQCALGTSCKACLNKPHYWPVTNKVACGKPGPDGKPTTATPTMTGSPTTSPTNSPTPEPTTGPTSP